MGFPSGSMVKNPAANVGDVGSILKKKMVTHFSIFAWEIPWTEEPGRPQSMGSAKESDMT